MSLKRASLCLAAALLFSPSNLAYADMENIVVTASRLPTTISGSGNSVTVISRADIEARNALTLADLLREVAGFAVSESGGPGTLTQIRVRGAESNHVLVFVDGIEANDISQGGDFNFSHLLAGEIERIEIVRGPQSAIWGSDAVSGVINIQTNSQASESSARVRVETGTEGLVNTSIKTQYVTQSVQLSGGLTFLETDGTNISRTGTEDDGYENLALNIAARASLSEQIDLNLTIRDQSTTSDYDGTDFVTTGLSTDAPSYTDAAQQYARLGIQLEFMDGRLNQQLSWSRTDTSNKNYTAPGTPVDTLTAGTKDQLVAQTSYHHNSHGFALVLEREQDEFQQRGTAGFFGDPNKDLKTDTNSVAIEYRFQRLPFDLSASVRHDDNADFGNSNPWRLSAAWQLNPDHQMFATAGRSTKNPGFSERFGYFDTFIGNPNLTPEESESLELGLSSDWFDNTVQSRVTWFSANLENEINGFVYDIGAGAYTAENVAGESSREGVELEIDWQLSDSFRVRAAYTYLDATEDSAVGEVDEIRRPRQVASINTNYRWQHGNVNLAIAYTGEQLDNYFPPFPPYQQRVSLSAYTLVNLSGSYDINHNLRLSARIRNLLDESYEDIIGFSTPGTSAAISLRWSI